MEVSGRLHAPAILLSGKVCTKSLPKDPGLVLPFGQKQILGLLATITLEVVPFRTYALFPGLLSFLNTSWKSCFVTMFRTARDSVSTTSIVSKWRPFSFIFNRGNTEQ
jgi:hypothetical protein